MLLHTVDHIADTRRENQPHCGGRCYAFSVVGCPSEMHVNGGTAMTIDCGSAENWRSNFDRMTVDFKVLDDGKPITCRVTRECINDNFGDPQTDDDRLDAAKARFDQITDIAMMLIRAGRFEEDGSIIIRGRDWRSR